MKHALFLQDLAGVSRAETRELLLQAGCEHQPLWAAKPFDEPSRAGVEILVTSRHEVPEAVLSPWPNLKMVSLAFTGYNGVDLPYCRRRGLHVYYVPGYATDSVAELTVALTLAVLRRIPTADRHVREGVWDRGGVQPGIELAGKTIGILGTGAIGMRSATLFQAFGCKLIGWSRTRRPDFPGEYKEPDDLAGFFKEADVVAVHLPLGDGTAGIVSREMIGQMRPAAVLVNTSRAGIVDREALVDALRERRIGGVGLDVFADESEGAKDDPLVLLEGVNVVATPHLGFKTAEALDRLARITIENIGRYLRGDSANRLVPSPPDG